MSRRLALAGLLVAGTTSVLAAAVRFEVGVQDGLVTKPANGRLFVVLSPSNRPEPRFGLASTETNRPQAFAQDASITSASTTLQVDDNAFGYPIRHFSSLAGGDYFVQAVFDSNRDLRSANAPGNLFSEVRRVTVNPASTSTIQLKLTRVIPAETLPADSPECKFIRLPSPLLSRFHGRPMFLRAGVILPVDYDTEPNRRYPLWIRIGGFATRFTATTNLMASGSQFRKTWMAKNTPRFILVQLDGAGPFGDPYQVNSANNGPYGDAVVQELIPAIEQRFRAVGAPHARVLSGTSTGGWVALALQVFYPDTFNGAWASCPDPVDFRAFELVNVYEDENAYRNRLGDEIPSSRDLSGRVTLTMRQEVGMENLLGRGHCYTTSGEQWGSWNAVFSPRGTDGLPAPIWDPQTGRIDHEVAKAWERYDLRLVLERHPELSRKVRNKLHIDSAEADQYYLNGAVHLLEASLSQVESTWKPQVVYGRGKGHGWSHLSLLEMLRAMQNAVESR